MNQAKYRVLIVDDSPEDRILYRRLLMEQRGEFDIIEASEAQEALARCQQNGIDCLLLDYRLPEQDGLEVLRQFGNSSGVPKVPVIMLTGQGDERVAVEAMKTGAQDYLVKGKITGDGLRRAIVNAIEKVALLQRIEEQRRELERLATTDGLTGLYNYRCFMERLEEEINRARRFSVPMAILLLDLDHFKQVNDTYGHLFGDTVLIQVAEIIQASLRRTDFAARYGGEEFCVLAVGADRGGALVFANRLRQRICEIALLANENQPVQITCSIGAAELDDTIENARQLLQRADQALYEAKRSGRNRVASATP